MTRITNVHEATVELTNLIQSRGGKIKETENLATRGRYGNIRIFTTNDEVYHLKYSKKLFKPRENVVGGAEDLDHKLKFAIKYFGNGDNTLNGIDEDLLVELLELEQQGYLTYFVTVMSDGRILWRTGKETYEFIMRYDTTMHFPKSFNHPVCFVPTGWLVNKTNLVTGFPTLAS